MQLRDRIDVFLDSPIFRWGIIAVIIFNAAVLGLETSAVTMARFGGLLSVLDAICLGIFIAEICAKLFARGRGFFRDGWNLFDFAVIALAIVPAGQGFSVLRVLRILRVLRVISVAPRLRRVVHAFFSALPGMASVFVLMGIIFYAASVMATKLFGASFPDWFGTLGRSGYTLFQIMTLESWSMGIVRPVMEVHDWAWAFFLPFILVTTFAVVNLLVGLIVNSMQAAHSEEGDAMTDAYRDEVLARLKAIEERLDRRG